MDAFLELAELFGRLSTAASFVAICTLLKQYAANYGLNRISVFDLRLTTRRASEAVVCSDVPRKLLRRLDRAGDFTMHPLVQRARTAREPFEISVQLGLGAVRRRAAFNDVFPPINGLVVPVQDAGAVVAMATLIGPKPALTPLAYDTLKLAVQAGWQRSKQLDPNAAPGAGAAALTLREFECLHWVAKGKTDQEVGRILSISARTVRFHVDNAKTKLGVTTRIQAVTKLLRERPELA